MDKTPIEGPVLPSSRSATIETGPSTRRSRASLKDKFRQNWAILVLFSYLFGLGSGFFIHGNLFTRNTSGGQTVSGGHDDMAALVEQINPPEGVKLPAKLGDIGPKLVLSGAINYDRFAQIYLENGKPLDEKQITLLTRGSDDQIVITPNNQNFWLNFFWALGLANKNKVLTEGRMMQDGREQVVNFASTGGWTLADRPIGEIYASEELVNLTEDQQKRLEEVTRAVYRPCCDNPTHFPDCNHGMAMLGLLELMASQGASVNAMFEAAKYVNAYWFPQQNLELALLYKTLNNVGFRSADARAVVGANYASSSGFQNVHQWLVQNGKLDQAPQGGGSCGVK